MFRRFGNTARPRRATASLSPEAARRHAARETSAAHKAPWVSGWSFSASPAARNLGAAPGVPLVVASPARTLRASLSSTASRGGGVPNASRDASRALASCSCHPRRRSSSKTYAAASLGFAGHDAPGSPCASAFFAARRKRVTTSSTSRGSRVAHASTSHDGGGGGSPPRPSHWLEVFTHRRQEEKFRVRRLRYDERSVQLCIITRVARCGVSLGRAPSDRAQKLIGCHSRARWGRADGKHGGGDALPRQVRSGVHRGVYSPKNVLLARGFARVGRRRRPTVASSLVVRVHFLADARVPPRTAPAYHSRTAPLARILRDTPLHSA